MHRHTAHCMLTVCQGQNREWLWSLTILCTRCGNADWKLRGTIRQVCHQLGWQTTMMHSPGGILTTAQTRSRKKMSETHTLTGHSKVDEKAPHTPGIDDIQYPKLQFLNPFSFFSLMWTEICDFISSSSHHRVQCEKGNKFEVRREVLYKRGLKRHANVFAPPRVQKTTIWVLVPLLFASPKNEHDGKISR